MPRVGDRVAQGDVSVRAVGVGGIDETEVGFGPGVTVLSGRNATNRSSLLYATMAALGSDAASLKAGAERGRVELSIGEETYTREFERTEDGVRTRGDPYCADPTVAELFAFLVEDNRARRAVERIDDTAAADLREVLMEPVDTGHIEAEIDRLREERNDVDDELQRVEELERELPGLERQRDDVAERLADVREELASVERRIDDAEGTIQPGQDATEELEERLASLREEQSALEDLRYDLETERESRSELRSEREELEAELDELDSVTPERLESLADRVESLRSERSSLESEINELQSVIGFNEDMLAQRTALFEAEDGEDPTEQLVATDRTVSCWTCGSAVSVDEVEKTLEHLRERRQRKVQERAELGDEIDHLESERSKLEQRRQRRTELEDRLDDVVAEIGRVEDLIEERREAVERREERVEELEADVAALEAEEDDHRELIELHREAQELSVRVERLESEHAELEERVAEVEAEVQQRCELEDRREAIGEQIEDLRTRVERVEQEAVDAFNDHMAEVLDVLDYDNIERVWLERRRERDGGRSAASRRFEHHVVRSGADGATFEDSVDNLSESEREVVGLVVALAGYLVHDVHEEVPFVLLDSLEAIDAERIAALVEYFEPHVEYLVVALLPEDAQALDDGYEYVTSF